MFTFHDGPRSPLRCPSFPLAATVAASLVGIGSQALAQSSCNNATLSAWGRNGSGERSVPTLSAAAKAVTAGGFNDKAHAGALLVNGRAVFWGDNTYGQVYGRLPGGAPRNGTPGDPVRLESGILENIIQISAGAYHSVAVTSDGRVHAWGGSLPAHVQIPVQLNAAFGVSVSAGQWHSIALLDDGKVIGWGKNDYGQCGGFNAAGAPVTSEFGTGAVVQAGASDLTGVMGIAAGGNHNVALKSNGSVVAWGDGFFQQCAVPSNSSVSVQVGAGTLHSMAVLPSGRVVCWGYNGPASIPDGRVYGTGATGAPLNGVPGDFVRIGGQILGDAVPVVAVAGGGSHSAACLSDGTVVCWGGNADGQRNVPFGLDDVRSIDCGDAFTIALSAPLPSATIVQKVNATCTRNNGSIDVTMCDTQHFSWSGPNGFQSSSEDLTNLFPGVYVLGMEGAGGSNKLYVEISDIADTVPPDIISYHTQLEAFAGTDCSALVPNFLSEMQYSDNCTVVEQLVVTQVPAAGTSVSVAAGQEQTTHEVKLKVVDQANNFAEETAIFIVKKYPVCGCGVPDTDIIPTAAGNGVPDCVDVTASMQVIEGIPAFPWAGSSLKIRVKLADTRNDEIFHELAGIQLALQFDPSLIQLQSVNPIAGSPLAGELNKIIDNVAGTLRYGLYTLPDSPGGLTDSADICELVFSVPANVTLCGVPNPVRFGVVDGVATHVVKMSDGDGQAPLLTPIGVLKQDSQPPVIEGVPDSKVLPVDPDLSNGARVAKPNVVAKDDCDPDVGLSFSIVYPDGATVNNIWPSSDIFPIGTSTITYSCTDEAASPNTVTKSFTVTVRNEHRIEIQVSFEGGNFPFADDNADGANDITRLIRIAPGAPQADGTVPPYQERLIPITGGVLTDIRIPVTSAGFVSAKDPVHSLRRRGAGAPSTDAEPRRFVVSLQLVQGDSDDNNLIDILDYGAWIADRSTPTNSARALDARSNFNGDTFVNSADFAFLAGANFFRNGDPALQGGDSATPRHRVSVKDLRREGRGDLVAADLNLDGWLDLRDLQLALQGVTQPAAPSAPADGLEGNH